MTEPAAMSDPFANLPRNHYGRCWLIPPWSLALRSDKGKDRSAESGS